MALKSFGRGSDMPGSDASLPSPPSSGGSKAAGGLTAFIDQGSEFEGKLSFRDTVRIDGRFRGEISSENTLIVGESGEIDASIRSNTIAISGTVMGDVIAERKVVLHKTARVEGNVETASIAIEEGAILNGQVKMVPAGGKKDASLKAVPSGGSKPQGPGESK